MPVNTLTLSLLFGLAVIGLATQANSQGTPAPAAQSLPAVRSAAEAALRRQLDPAVTGVIFEAAELDSRLRLAACPAPFAVNAALPRGTQSRGTERHPLSTAIAARCGRLYRRR
jgi:hypothetical protein